ncbi:MAG: pyruvate carboxylase subunit B, partial [Pedosphaera parvula]|nr:pyruvate carboxylase subunit B [Pedosphaera parvula]
QMLLKLGPKKFADWVLQQKQLLVTDTTFRDAHQSLLATRVRTYDMEHVGAALARRAPELFSVEIWGGAKFDTSMRFLHEDPWIRLRKLRARIPNICFQMLFRGSNAVGYSNYPDNVVAGFVKHAAAHGVDIFRIFDSLNYLPNLKVAMETVQQTHGICEGSICYTGDILDEKRTKYSLKYYLKLARELERMGAHMLGIKDMAGLCKPYAARALVKALKEEIGLPIHFHTHDTSGVAAASVLQAAEAGVDIADLAIGSMSGSTSQPNLNAIVAALRHTRRDTGLDLDALNEFSNYWELVRELYAPFDTGPRSGSANVYLHEMPGGQYTNLKEQAASMGLLARWPEIERMYADVNQLFGDIVKVTPSSKVVGDMTMFLITRDLKPADVLQLEPGSTPFPESVIDMLAGGLGQPMGGWPKKLQKVVLGDRETYDVRPGARLKPISLQKVRAELTAKLRREASEDDVYSYLMYPEVFLAYARHAATYGDLAVLPTPAFFYGMKPGEEITVDLEEGKTLFIRLMSVSPVDDEGKRVVSFELNGVARQTSVVDKSVRPKVKSRAKADSNDPLQ